LVEASVNVTVRGTVPDSGVPENPPVKNGAVTIYVALSHAEVPPEFVAV
jgi:hypothetical protein